MTVHTFPVSSRRVVNPRNLLCLRLSSVEEHLDLAIQAMNAGNKIDAQYHALMASMETAEIHLDVMEGLA